MVLTSLPVRPGCVSSSRKREVTTEDGAKAACDPLSLALACPIQLAVAIRDRREVKGGEY